MARRIQLNKVDYSGGHPDFPKPHKGVVLVVDDEGVHVRVFTEKCMIPWANVTAVAVDGPEQAAKRLTATRLVGLGIFAFAAKKNTSEAYLQLDTPTYTVSFQVPKTSAGDLRTKLGSWIHRLPEPPTVADAPSPQTAASELGALADLRDRGVLSEEEFAAEKARVLER